MHVSLHDYAFTGEICMANSSVWVNNIDSRYRFDRSRADWTARPVAGALQDGRRGGGKRWLTYFNEG